MNCFIFDTPWGNRIVYYLIGRLLDMVNTNWEDAVVAALLAFVGMSLKVKIVHKKNGALLILKWKPLDDTQLSGKVLDFSVVGPSVKSNPKSENWMQMAFVEIDWFVTNLCLSAVAMENNGSFKQFSSYKLPALFHSTQNCIPNLNFELSFLSTINFYTEVYLLQYRQFKL